MKVPTSSVWAPTNHHHMAGGWGGRRHASPPAAFPFARVPPTLALRAFGSFDVWPPRKGTKQGCPQERKCQVFLSLSISLDPTVESLFDGDEGTIARTRSSFSPLLASTNHDKHIHSNVVCYMLVNFFVKTLLCYFFVEKRL